MQIRQNFLYFSGRNKKNSGRNTKNSRCNKKKSGWNNDRFQAELFLHTERLLLSNVNIFLIYYINVE